MSGARIADGTGVANVATGVPVRRSATSPVGKATLIELLTGMLSSPVLGAQHARERPPVSMDAITRVNVS